MFISGSIFWSIAEFSTKEAIRRRGVALSPSLDKLESFIALQYAKELYGQNILLHFCGKRVVEVPFSVKQYHRTNLQKY